MKPPRWTTDQDDALRENYGLVARATLARQLGRTEEAVHIRAKRLGLAQQHAFLSARAAGRILGVDAKTVVFWIRQGALRGQRSAVVMGPYRLWRIDVADLERFLRERPGWYDAARVAEEPWAQIVREAQTDPMLTTAAAAQLLGVSVHTVIKHLRRGWLVGERAPVGGHGGPHGTWLVRRSALASFRSRNPSTTGVAVLRSVAGVNGRAKKRLNRTPLAVVPPTIARPQPTRVERQRVCYQPTDWRAS